MQEDEPESKLQPRATRDLLFNPSLEILSFFQEGDSVLSRASVLDQELLEGTVACLGQTAGPLHSKHHFRLKCQVSELLTSSVDEEKEDCSLFRVQPAVVTPGDRAQILLLIHSES